MRYGLSLLVCFALAACAIAQDCKDGKCKNPLFDVTPVKTAVKTVVTAPVAVVRGVSRQVSAAPKVGPVRRFFRR